MLTNQQISVTGQRIFFKIETIFLDVVFREYL